MELKGNGSGQRFHFLDVVVTAEEEQAIAHLTSEEASIYLSRTAFGRRVSAEMNDDYPWAMTIPEDLATHAPSLPTADGVVQPHEAVINGVYDACSYLDARRTVDVLSQRYDLARESATAE